MQLLTILQLEALFIMALFLPLLLQLVVLYAASRALWALTGRAVGRAAWVALALVGVPMHELSHAAAFLLTGAGVQRLVLFAPRGLPEYNGATGVVVPARQPSAFSRLVASIAPFFGCSFAAWLVMALLLPGFATGEGIAGLGLTNLEAGRIGAAAAEMLQGYLISLLEAFTRLDWTNWRTYLAVYLGASLGMGAAPSTGDFKRFFPALIGLLVILFPVFALIQVLSNPQTVLSGAQGVVGQLLLPIGAALTYATIFTLLALLLVAALLPFRRLVGH